MVIREYEGKTEKDAIKKASEDLCVESDKLKIEVIGERSRFFSFGRGVKIRVFLQDKEEELPNKAEDFLNGLFKNIDIDAKIEIMEDSKRVYIEIISDEAGIIIGKRGKTLEAIQLITNAVINRGREDWKKVVLDVEKYRNKRENALKELALKIASQVKKSGKSNVLEPMNPFERRIIHMALQNDPQVDTRSEGNGYFKKVRISLKKSRNK